MSRLTGKGAKSLADAYASIYEGYGKDKKEKECVDKEDKGAHNCAKKVCHEEFGEGTCIYGQHAVPDRHGFVSHYDVEFAHGIEKGIPVSEMTVLEEGSHNEENHWYAGEVLDEQGGRGAAAAARAEASRRQRVAAQQQVQQRLGSGGDIQLRDANPLRQNKPFFNPLSGSALPNQSNKAFGTQLTDKKTGVTRQGVVVKNAVGQGRGFAGASDTVNVAGQTLYKARRGKDIVYLQAKGKPQLFKPQAKTSETDTETSQPPSKTTQPTSAPKQTFTPQSGDKAKDMATWAKANPKLAAAAAEKARIRGTQQTDNPLMKDMKSRLPMNSPSVQSPDVAKLGKGNQSLVSNPNAFKAATPAAKPAPTATATPPAKPAPAAAAPAPVAPKPQLSARAQALKAGGPAGSAREKMLKQDVDVFDLVKGFLIDEGATEEEAMKQMVSMTQEQIQAFAEGYKEIDRAKHGRMYNRYKKLRTAAMDDARETGEASGENRRKMGKMSTVLDKSAENLRNKG